MGPSERVRRFKYRMQTWYRNGPLYRWRKKLGINIREASIILGVSDAAYYKWEREGLKVKIKNDDLQIKVRPRLNEPFIYTTWNAWCRDRTNIPVGEIISWIARRPRLDD